MNRREKPSVGLRRREPRGRAFAIDGTGRAAGVRYIVSPNCDERPAGTAITLLVIHNISLPPGKFGGADVVRLFTNTLDFRSHPFYETLAGLRVSAHFYVGRSGEVLQFVPCLKRAWHAGQSTWRGRPRCNDFSIGVELEGADEVAYADVQYEMLARLARGLFRAYPLEDVVGHADIAPGRKTDPGPAFDWTRFKRLLGRQR